MSVEKILHDPAEIPWRAKVRLPEEFQRVLDAFQGQGNIRIDNGEAIFEFWAADLWDAARICMEVESEVNPFEPIANPMRIEKPVEITDPHSDTP